MNSSTLPILVALFIQLALGLVVFQANRHRKSNQCFLVLSLVAVGWLASLYHALIATTPGNATFWIRQTSAFGPLLLTVFNLLRLSIKHETRSWGQIAKECRIWLLAGAGIFGFCQTNLFLEGSQPSHATGVFIPTYRHFFPYFGYLVVAGVILLVNYARDLRRTTAIKRSELAFILIGAAVAFGTIVLSFTLGMFIDRSLLTWFAPLRIVLFSLIISYGIATRKIMDVGVLLRRLISYVLLATYLLVLYAFVWWLVATALQSSIANAHTIAHVTAAVVIAFAMAPARGMSQRLAERLFIGSHRLDFQATVSKAAKILASVTTLRDLLDRFANTVAEAVGTERVFILLPAKQGFSQHYPIVEPGSRFYLELTRDQATIAELESNREPIVMDELRRVKPTPQLQRVLRQLD
jgi:hypothetical protein